MTPPIDTTPEAIAALLDGVTPGPWGAALERGCHGIVAAILPDGANMVALIGNSLETPEREPTRFANARFIAAARELVPALAAEIASLTAERDEARAQVAALLNRKAIGDPSQNSGYDLAVIVFDAGDDGDPWLTYRSGEGWRLHRKEEPK